MVYMKHHIFGNRHVPESEVADRRAAGWVKWPRSPEEKQGVVVPATFVAEDAPIKRKPGRPKKA